MIFPIKFLICNVFLTILLFILLSARHLMKRQLTPHARYGLWYVFSAALLLPFLPFQNFSRELFYLLASKISHPAFSRQISAAAIENTAPAGAVDLWLQDFSTAMTTAPNPWISRFLWGIWIAGGCVAALHFIRNILRIFLLRKHAFPITKQTEPELYQHYVICLRKLHIHRNIALYASCQLSSPVSYGLMRPRIIIPRDLDILMTEKEIQYIFLHELQHYRHRDALLNNLSCLLQILYWFNPLIWYSFRQMQKDRELACDNAVMKVIGQENYADYGFTLIRYAQAMKNGMFLSPLSGLGGTKKFIHERIVAIANYQRASAKQKIRSGFFLLLAASIVLCTSPLFMVQASSSTYRLTGRNQDPLDVSTYFEDRNGTFVLYDITADRYQIYNQEMSEQRVSPDSTYKIYCALAALEENLISPSSIQRWDGTPQIYDAWNRDQTLTSAMQNSVNWYFQNLDRQMGLSALSSYFRKFSYGNCDLTGGIENYWAESSLKISPIEQVNVLADLWQNKWNLNPQNIQAVKDSLFLSELSIGTLYGKTGTGNVDGQNCNGWFIGFLENDSKIYCFATNLRDEENADGSSAAQITIDILNNIL